MHRFPLLAATAATLLSLAPAAAGGFAAKEAPAGSVPQPAQAAAAAVDAFHAALRRGDASAALALMADDALVFEEGRAERSKAEYAASHAAADAAFSKAVATTRLRRTGHAATDLAWISSESRTKGNFKGRLVDRIMVETMVLRRVSGAWRIIHIHWSSAEPATE
ncbi:MAG TPA: nuclear transport factor 2 family protein [Allosphingosinicella sp.]|jgi:ketosteroid isomerase-like protein